MTEKTLWIIANWKSNKTISEALEWIGLVGPKLEKREDLKIVVCPTFDAISEIKKAIQVGGFSLMVGSQDLSPFDLGAYTGEEPASVLSQYVELAILGHSERRINFNETDEMVQKKVEMAKQHNIIPLVCLQGENTPIPEGCDLVAYEPVEAIGTGNPDDPLNTDKVARSLKSKKENSTILYGGSVTAGNVKNYLELELISGVLVGTASLEAEEFLKIIEVAKSL